jgi:Phage capsid family
MLLYLQRLATERESLTAAATGLADTAAQENRDLTETEQASLSQMQTRCAEIDRQLQTYNDQAESQRAYATLRSRLDAMDGDGGGQGHGSALATRSPAVIEEWVDPLVGELERSGYNGRGSLELGDAPLLFQRAPVMLEGFQGTIPPYYFQPTPWKPTSPLLDICGRVTVSSNSIEWYGWPPGYPAAPEVPEGQVKPEIDYVPVPHSDSLKTYAHHKPLSRQALEDIPQIRSIIETALRGGVLRALEAGIVAALAAAVAATEIGTVTNADMLTGLRLGLAHVQMNGYAVANGIVMHPDDYAALDVRVMEETVTGPNVTTRMWGLPVIVSADMTVGQAYVGDFKTAVTLFARNAMSVFMSDSHADYFIKNLLVLLAEQRALPAVTAGPAAVQVVVGAAGTASASAPATARSSR